MTCDVIKDLIPMYADRTASAQTSTLVKKHIAVCPCCREYYKECRRLEKREREFEGYKEKVHNTFKNNGSEIGGIDQQFAFLSRKLKARRIRHAIIASLLLVGVAVYVTLDIVKTVRKK